MHKPPASLQNLNAAVRGKKSRSLPFFPSVSLPLRQFMTKVWFKVKEVGVLMSDWVKTPWRSERSDQRAELKPESSQSKRATADRKSEERCMLGKMCTDHGCLISYALNL